MLAPLAAVLLFFAAIVSALGYLRVEEIEREQQAVRRDVEYAQQRVRLRLRSLETIYFVADVYFGRRCACISSRPTFPR